MRPIEAWAVSRALCWIAGVGGVLAFGAHAGLHDPLHLTSPFGAVGNKLVAPAARWDSAWYLLIADHGYVIPRATVFYPLYPLAARVVGAPFGSSLVGGIVVSLGALLAALWFLERLATVELGARDGRRAAALLAFFPTAVFFSAVYTESLFLALTIGAFYAARTDRWAIAGVLGGLATLTRAAGIVVLPALVVMYLSRPGAAGRGGAGVGIRGRIRGEILWLGAIPLAVVAYRVYLAAKFGDPFLADSEQAAWHRGFAFPLLTVWHGAARAFHGALQVFHGHAPNNVYEFGLFCLACVGVLGALRRLPIAYGVYAAVGLIVLVSVPISGSNLSSFSRFMPTLFPILMWLAAWSSERRLYRWVLAAFAVLMVVNAARFATWHFVA